MHNGYKEVADSGVISRSAAREMRHFCDGIVSNASKSWQEASHAQEVTRSHKLAWADAVEDGIKNNNNIEAVVPKDKNRRRSSAAG